MTEPVRRYGVREQTKADDPVARAIEDIRLLGYAVLDGGYDDAELDDFAARFDAAHATAVARHGGREKLAEIDEHNTIRALLAEDARFLDLARNPRVMTLCDALMGNQILLNQQNGIVNPPNNQRYNQGSWHRDLPYHHFTSSRPLAVNALFCVDAFTPENGATLVAPASHTREAFPSDAAIRAHQRQVTAPRGSFIVLDCMVFHSGGVNATPRARRAVNHVYTSPLMRQQIDLPTVLGGAWADDPELAPFLGYTLRTPATVEDYYAQRRAKLS